MAALSSTMFSPVVYTGGWMVTTTSVGMPMGSSVPLGYQRARSLIVTGTTGTPARVAILKGPG